MNYKCTVCGATGENRGLGYLRFYDRAMVNSHIRMAHPEVWQARQDKARQSRQDKERVQREARERADQAAREATRVFLWRDHPLAQNVQLQHDLRRVYFYSGIVSDSDLQRCRYPTDEYLAQLHEIDEQLSELQARRADLYHLAWEQGEEVTEEDIKAVYTAAEKAANKTSEVSDEDQEKGDPTFQPEGTTT